MKKYFFNGLFIFAVLFSATSFLTSCKDNLGDEMAKLENADNELQDKIDQLEQITDDLAAAQEACKHSCEEARRQLEITLKQYADTQDAALRAELENKISDLVKQIATLQGNITVLTNQINTNYEVLNTKIENLNNLVNTNNEEFNTRIEALNLLIEQLAAKNQELAQKVSDDLAALEEKLRAEYTGLINTLRQDVENLESIVNGLKPDIAKGVQAYEWMQTAKVEISTMQTEIANLKKAMEELIGSSAESLGARIDSLANVTSALESKYDALDEELGDAISKYDAAFLAVETAIDNLEDDVDDLKTDMTVFDQALDDLTDRVAANEQAIATLRNDLDELTGRVDVLENRLNQLITNILIQNVHNPVFGGFNVPLGINSNILVGQYGEAINNIIFPSYASSAISEYDGAAHFTQLDFQMLGSNIGALELWQGDLLSDLDDYSNVNLGTVYTTINPTDVDFQGTKFSLVNSQDEESGVTLSSPVKSDKVLTFGSTRAADNGFYEMTATVAKEDLEGLKLPKVATSGIKQAVKDAYHNKTIGNFARLAAEVAKAIAETEKLEAYGLKAAWEYEDNDGNMKKAATYSKYEVAATVYEPLSYKFMYGQSVKNLPTISPLSGLHIDKSQFTFDTDAPSFDFNGVEFGFSLKDVTVDPSAYTVTVEIEDFPIYDEITGTVTGTTTKTVTVSIENNIVAIEDAFNEQIATWNTEIQNAFKDAMSELESQINKQIDEYISDEIGKVNDNIGDLIDKINNKGNHYIDKANSIIEKANAVVERINRFLTDPNHYLQVMMVYEGSDGKFHHMSTSKAAPTVFVVNSGNAIKLYPTSYTAGIIVPSYKKFIGVTNVWDADGNAQADDSECTAALNTANSNEFMATVIDGGTLEVPMQVKPGYTYEIAYSSLDYHGVTSTQKYYIKVK